MWIRFNCLFALLIALMALCGCASPDPYQKIGNWALRQNAVPRYFADYDVFYVYPTLLREGEGEVMNWAKGTIAGRVADYAAFQTAAQFGRKVRIFAPMVHQLDADGYVRFLAAAPMKPRVLMKSPLGHAVRDAVSALEHYLDNYHRDGRPYVLYGQGQGARILYEAMKRCPAVTPESGFVAAYLPGLAGISASQIAGDFGGRGIRPASGEYDTAVIAAWNVPGEAVDYGDGFVINPLNWATGPAPAPAQLNLKSVFYDPWTGDYTRQQLAVTALSGAVISPEDALLHELPNPEVPRPAAAMFAIAPYGMYCGNVVENAGRRVRQYIYKSQWRNALPPALPELPPPGRREGAAAPESPAMQEAIQGNKQP